MDASVSAAPAATSCLVCGGTRAERRFVQRGYPVYCCQACGLQFVAPIPTSAELADYYNRSYAVPLERYAAAGHRNIARIAELERWCPERGRLLEFGASYGHSLALARDRGWDVAGVELSPTASAYARSHFGLNVFNCDLADAPLGEGSLDAVIGWHVLEHVRNPKNHLLRVAQLLKPGGVLGLRVPNIASFGARNAGQWWPWMCPPAHLWFFSAKTLPRLLETCGFEVLEVKTLRGDGNNVYQYALMALGNWLNDFRLRLKRKDRLPPERRRGRTTLPFVPPPMDPSELPLPVSSPASAPAAHAPSRLLEVWLRVLARAQPVTDALWRGTRPLVEPFERRGGGDELLVYARRAR